jgi:hypothetical protein
MAWFGCAGLLGQAPGKVALLKTKVLPATVAFVVKIVVAIILVREYFYHVIDPKPRFLLQAGPGLSSQPRQNQDYSITAPVAAPFTADEFPATL